MINTKDTYVIHQLTASYFKMASGEIITVSCHTTER